MYNIMHCSLYILKSPCCPLLVEHWQLQLFTSPSRSGRSSRTSGSVMQTLLVACAGPGRGRQAADFLWFLWQVPKMCRFWPTFLGACFSCRCEFSTWVESRSEHVSDPVLCTSMAVTDRNRSKQRDFKKRTQITVVATATRLSIHKNTRLFDVHVHEFSLINGIISDQYLKTVRCSFCRIWNKNNGWRMFDHAI